MNRYFVPLVCCVGSLIVVGCEKPIEPKNAAEKMPERDLKLLYVAYINFQDPSRPHPPRSLDDLKLVIERDDPIVFDRYHMIWGVDLKSSRCGPTVHR